MPARAPAPRFHVEVRLGGRMVQTLACGPELVIGEDGDVVVPGLGDAVALLRGGRLMPTVGLIGAVTGPDAPRDLAGLDATGVAITPGMRALVSPTAHPQIELSIEPLETEAVARGGLGTLIPARETVIAALTAGVIALWVGREIVRHELTEPERETPEEHADDTPIERAMYTVPTIVPEFVAAPVIRFADPEPPPPLVPDVMPDVVPELARVAAVAPEIASPVALPDAAAKPVRARKRGPKRRRSPDIGTLEILSALERGDGSVAMLLDSSSGQGSGLIGNSIDEVRSDRVLGAIDPDSIVARGAGLAIRGSDGPGSNEDQLVDIVTRREVEEPERVPPREVPTELIVEGGVEGGVPGGVEGGVVGGVPGGVEGGVVGGVPGGVAGGVAGGVEGGVEGGVPGGVAGGVVAPKLDPDAPPPPDPHGGAFDLAEALAGDPSLAPDRPGKLAAVIRTSRGTMRCELFDDRAPRTVANFIGLARGVRAWLDPATNTWERRPLYAGTPLHRVIDGFMIQGGDPEGSGRGGPGYTFADEIDPTLGYDAPGVLAMANRGPDTNGSQFFVTVAPTPHLQGRSTIFGQCEPTLPLRIAKVPVDDRDRPKREVRIESITIVRE